MEHQHSDENSRNIRKDIFEHVTTVTHTLVFGVVGFLIYLCCEGEWSFFTWHPFLYTIGWVCLMLEAILVVSPENIFSKHLPFKLRVHFHWIVQTLAIGCSFGGFFVDFINKNDNDWEHFQSDHAICGLVAMVCLIPTTLNGFAALFSIELKRFIKPSLNKLIHAICGAVAFVAGSVAMILGLFTGWFESKTGTASQTFCVFILSFATLWCLVRPFLTSYNRIKSLF